MLMKLSPDLVLDHHRETLSGQAEAIQADRDTLLGFTDLLPVINENITELPYYPARFYTGTTIPTFAHGIIECAYSELINRVDRDEPTNDIAALVGLTFGRLLGVKDLSRNAVSGKTRALHVDACSEAEHTFRDTIQQVIGGTCEDQKFVSVYHTQSGKPLLLRKTRPASTALTLDWLEINGVPVAPATIVRPPKTQTESMTGHAVIEQEGWYKFLARTFVLPETPEITPSRLSPWFHEEELDRALFAVDKNGDGVPDVDPYRLEPLVEFKPDHLQLAAEKIMTACGVAEPCSA